MSRSSVCDGAVGDADCDVDFGTEDTRGQVEPLAALAAVFAVCVGLALYGGVLSSVTPETSRNLAEPTLDRVHDRVSTGGVAVPERLDAARAVGPEGYDLNLSLTADDRRWSVGETPPQSTTDTASRPTGVRIVPGRVDPGRLRVVIWS
ncbi:DUF7285 family protein [Salinirubrum litoreum]|uniref:Pilin/flagellin n=1 Tax=Salinirubrum litoreum TaxID=1126234 RepID=A0ABD5RAS6_9EURY|nr:hypothetical protein [Salinirubrum litoreum]